MCACQVMQCVGIALACFNACFLNRYGCVLFAVLQVTQVNGNYALSLLLTVTGNLLGIATVPGLLNWRANFGATVQLNAAPLVLKLSLTLLLPLVVRPCLVIA